MQLPAIDQNMCANWTQLQNDAYNKLDYYLVKAQTEARKHWTLYSKNLPTVRWQPNMGPTMRQVATEFSPLIRQRAYPNTIQTIAKTDIFNIRERSRDSAVHWHKFRSPNFYFLPEFQDFMKHMDDNTENITKQIALYEESYVRTALIDRAPYIYICGIGLVAAPTGDGNDDGTAVGSKTNAWWQAQITALMGTEDGTLTFKEVFKILNLAETVVGMTPFRGSGLPDGDSNPLNQQFMLGTGAEQFNQFTDDPWTRENRPLAMNIVTDKFKGELFGRIVTRLENFPMRFALDNDNAITIPAPETIEENPDRDDFGRTRPNPSYSIPENAPVQVSGLMGGKAAERLEVGPPPGAFTKGGEDIGKMNWNGRVRMTDKVLVPCLDQNGTQQLEMNADNEYLQLRATLAMGMAGINQHNFLPILHKRRIGITTTT